MNQIWFKSQFKKIKGDFYIKLFWWLVFVCLMVGVWTQGLALARQVLYHSSQCPSSFCFSFFSDRMLCFFLGWPGPWSSYLHLPCNLGCRCDPLHPAYCLRWMFANFLPDHNLPNVHLPSRWDYKQEPSCLVSFLSFYIKYLFIKRQ
jgi:hypothetical protein